MIAYLGGWIQQIVLLILMATFLDLLLPNNSMRRYVKMVVGLLIILVILSPVLDLLQFDHDRLLHSIDQLVDNESDGWQKEIEEQQAQVEQTQEDAILQEVEKRWAQEMEQGIETSVPVIVHELFVHLEEDGDQVGVQGVHLNLSIPDAANPDEQEDESGRKDESAEDSDDEKEGVAAVRTVEPVRIEVVGGGDEQNKEAASMTEMKLEDKVLTYLEEEWNITVDKISFSWTRR